MNTSCAVLFCWFCRVAGKYRSLNSRSDSRQPWLALGFNLFLMLSLSACSADKSAPKTLVRVAVQEVVSSEVMTRVELTGDIQARKVTDQAFRVSGKLAQRYVDVGDRVRAGQRLARLDPREQNTELASADAEVAARESRLRLAQSNYQRQQTLLPKGYTNLSEYQKAQSALEGARGDLAALKAQQANARDQLSYTELFAVADGIITARHVEEGQVVQAATPIFSLAHDGEREAVFAAYETLLESDQPGRSVSVHGLGHSDLQLSGRIREITPIVSSASGTLLVRVALQAAPANLALGTVVTAKLDSQPRKAFTLPWSALSRSHGKPAVWRVDEQNRVRLVAVQVLRYEQGQVVIASGVADGDWVVSRGLQFLYPGQRVDVAEREGRARHDVVASAAETTQ
ncbi:efflux RND transporter periplasmic adaptor subunit [Pseudomonas caspiana]|uniref:RND transporter n=1 Tax=Pseudomonas caspiana TaxID=1451454 RepID=A0A1Y3NW24_9PSED|nr:efflux RND transporter periplasmic adaptor subunit [Pseudomonas caspiana]OUM71786.1 RND transporter [Pseudomonas caspiana]